MVHDANLQFIREKVCKLRNAVMYVSSEDPFKLGNDIITAINVDAEGQLWFLTNRPLQGAEECAANFPARLLFYKKGVEYFVEVSGKASIVNYNYKDVSVPSPANNKILVRMTMMNVEYSEPHNKRPKNRIELLLENAYNWFLRTFSIPHHHDSVLKRLRQTN